jgi:hypothetical protein
MHGKANNYHFLQHFFNEYYNFKTFSEGLGFGEETIYLYPCFTNGNLK